MNRTRVFFVCLFVLCMSVQNLWAQFDFSNPSWSIPIDSNETPSSNFSSGIAIQDINADGFDDIAVAENMHGITLWLSDGSGFSWLAFIDLTQDIKQISFVDSDNDHDLELFVCAYGGGIYLYESNDLVNWNLIQNTFTEYWGYHYGASWADYDRDGDLDVFVCQYVDFLYSQGMPNLFFENLGDYNFIERSNDLGLSQLTNNSFQSVWFDFNHDGWLDLYVINDHEVPNLFYRNANGEYFIESAQDIGANISMFCMSNSISDFDNDGDWNIFMTDDNNPVLLDLSENQIYTNIADSMGFEALTNGWGALWIDADYDGDEDLHIAQGWIGVSENNLFYFNNGDGFTQNNQFDTLSLSSFINAKGDFNNDGRWDLVIRNEFPSQIQIGIGVQDSSTNWLKINLEGLTSNFFGIGAIVQVHAGGVSQQFINHCGENYISQNSSSTIVGLNNWNVIDSVVVTWPSSAKEKWYDLNVNQGYHFIEGSTLQNDTMFLTAMVCSQEGSMYSLPGHWYYDSDLTDSIMELGAGEHDLVIFNQWGWSRPCRISVLVLSQSSFSMEKVWACDQEMYITEWTSDEPQELVGLNYPLDTLPPGSYDILWMNDQGCWQEEEIQLEFIEVPQIQLLFPDTICESDSLLFEYEWENEYLPQWMGTAPEIIVPGNYEVAFTDSMGCMHTSTFTVASWEIFTVTHEVEMQGSLANVEMNIQGDYPPFEVVINGAILPDWVWTSDVPGEFVLEVTDGHGCTVYDTITIEDSVNINHLNPYLLNENGHSEVRIYDSIGKLLYHGRMDELIIDDNSIFSSGMLIIQSEFGTYKWIKK